MARHECFICERCGAETLNFKGKPNVALIRLWRPLEYRVGQGERIDLCEKCYNDFLNLWRTQMIGKNEKIKLAKAELNSYYDLFMKTSNLKTDLAELRERMNSCRITKYDDEVRGTAPNDSVEELFDKLHEIECKIAQNIWAMSDKQLELVDKIHKLNGVYADILHKRYIERKKFEVISVELCYDYDYVRKLHSDALVAYFNKHFVKN